MVKKTQAFPLLVLVLMMAGLLGGTVSASSARPSLTLTTAHDRAATNGAVGLAGTSAEPLREVTLQRRSAGRWAAVKEVRDPGTRYSFTVTPAGNTAAYRVEGTTLEGSRRVSKRVVVTTGNARRTTLPGVREQILVETNAHRQDAGLAPLALIPAMNTVATDWSEEMAKRRTLEHNPQHARQIPSGWTRAGENIAYGYDYHDVTTGWYESPGHRANLLGDYTHIGIGYAVTDDGEPYYTQNFAKY